MTAILRYHPLPFVLEFFTERANVLQAALQYVEQGAKSPAALFPNRTPNEHARAAAPFNADWLHVTVRAQRSQDQCDDNVSYT